MRMIITGFHINGGDVSISLDGELWEEIPYEITFQHRLELGMQVTTDTTECIMYDTNVHKCMKYALGYLAKYSTTERTLYNKLTEKSYPSDVSKHVISRMVEYGYLNDQYYAERFVASKITKLGKSRLKSELYARGIASDIIAQVLDDTSDDEILESAIQVGQKWFNSHYLDTKEDEMKLIRFMQYRGYDFSVIKKVISKLKEQDDDN